MNEFAAALVTLLLLCLSAGLGRYIRPRLPETYRSRETIEIMQFAIGMLLTFVALVLGLLTASVKNTYDTASRDRHAYALELIQLDLCLRDYGPDAEPAREDLKAYTAAVIASTWPNEPPPTGVHYPNTASMPLTGATPALSGLMNRIGQEIRRLDGDTPVRARTAEDCHYTFRDVGHARLAVIEDVNSAMSMPFFWMLVVWLMMVFFAFGLVAPGNRLALVGIMLCAVALSSATFVIANMSRPYRSAISIPSDTMRDALAQMMADEHPQ